MLQGQINAPTPASRPVFGKRAPDVRIPGVQLPPGHNGGPSAEDLFKNWRKGPSVRAEKERKALEELEALWPRRFAGIPLKAAKAIWMGALTAAGAWLRTKDEPDADQNTATPPDPIAVLACSLPDLHLLLGRPTIAPGDINPEMGAWIFVEHGKAGRASIELRLYTRAPKDALDRALDLLVPALRQAGHPVLYRDAHRAPRQQVANAHVGVLRMLPKAA